LVSDCLSMIQHILSEDRDRFEVGAVVSDIKKLCCGVHHLFIQALRLSYECCGTYLSSE
jgi:hypothetical protein